MLGDVSVIPSPRNRQLSFLLCFECEDPRMVWLCRTDGGCPFAPSPRSTARDRVDLELTRPIVSIFSAL